ncbi:class I SAM-dependent methyltransferase [Pseudalkalibacillus berkeleyi]|uniref:Class I SAM-dependent methyltransferase n=1 Tax=Pseudalkalibacillus berkeleyi TaxID=1069813 RepID=A0ABS9H3F5_9BACL|nr:class I SAM-dependent methyltransferase [Pseudalkalibacillus berkeleyi]MCF6139483.1 class I SAM-dependent methyltransferase [Pseudalkalibacillus berkeleyi]
MGSHYYSNKPSVESNRKDWAFELKGKTFRFYSDSGVFSKNEVDFGSRLLIESFEATDVDVNILDMGCGYGPIGLALAASYPKAEITMVDVNERAIQLSKDNARRNQIANVDIFQSNLFENVTKSNYHAILTNPPIRAGKDVVHAIFEQAHTHLLPGGELWIVIQKKQGAPSAIEKLESIFDEVDVVERKKGYFIIRSKKS